MTAPITQLISAGNVVIDIVATVDDLPERGGDVFASGGRLEPGGGFNLMLSARRQGLPTAHAGTTGTGPFGELARAGLLRERITTLLAPVPGIDTGFDVAIIDRQGERTFVTVVGAEGALTAARLDTIEIAPTDAFYVSGYCLLHPENRAAILSRLPRLPELTTVVYDPGPLGHTVSAEDVDVVLSRADWWSSNDREAMLATGLRDPNDAVVVLAARLPRGRVVVRTGRDGCLLGGPRGKVLAVPGYPVDVVDTNGAGDAHTGAFIAGLAAGLDPHHAAARANAVAALSVTRSGPATAPTSTEVDEFLESRG
jgi:sugar/nucleoside kinase (ribokinase family)